MINPFDFLDAAGKKIAEAVRVALKTELLEEDVRFALARLQTLHPGRSRYQKMLTLLDSTDATADQ
jgi:hypothetical protein